MLALEDVDPNIALQDYLLGLMNEFSGIGANIMNELKVNIESPGF